MRILQPAGWPRPKGYSNGIKASGELVFLAGLVAWNEKEPNIPFDCLSPRKAFLDWQKAAPSNRMTFRRDYCWEEKKRGCS